MADRGGANITFSGGSVSGARSDLYTDDDTTISVNFAAPIGEIVGLAGGYNHPNFFAGDINIGGFSDKVFGIDLGLNVTYNREFNAPAVSFDGSLIVGGTRTVIIDSWNPFQWDWTGNTYMTLSTGGTVGVLGAGVGASLDLTADEGQITAGASASFGLAGITSQQTIVSYGDGASQNVKGPTARELLKNYPSDGGDPTTGGSVYPDGPIRAVALQGLANASTVDASSVVIDEAAIENVLASFHLNGVEEATLRSKLASEYGIVPGASVPWLFNVDPSSLVFDNPALNFVRGSVEPLAILYCDGTYQRPTVL